MASAVATKHAFDSPDRNEMEDILRLLLKSLKDKTGDAREASFGNYSEEILLDIDVDDARYLVVRMPKTQVQEAQLSPREQEIVRMVAEGHPNKVIADLLGISSWTVGTYLRRIFAKTGVGSRAAMVAKVMNGKARREVDSPGSDAWAGLYSGAPPVEKQRMKIGRMKESRA